MLAVDGTDPELVRTIMETDIAYLAERHEIGANIFATMGGFAPTLGVIGTVAGLVHMLANLSDPGSMGPSIAAAFIATLARGQHRQPDFPPARQQAEAALQA